MIKDLENIKGDLANDYKRFLCYGEMVSKQIITALTVLDYLTCVCPD
jgi:4-hydroxybenzoate polyprenyltransferase